MQKLKIEEHEYLNVSVGEVPEHIKQDLKGVRLESGNCLGNSYNVAQKLTDVNMVEGFLVTLFEEEQPECVGHVWNEWNGQHFDVTIDLKLHDRKVKENIYFVSIVYSIGEAQVEKRPKSNIGLNVFFASEFETHLVFKSNVKSQELKAREFVRSELKRQN
jgi:hypothetical protein